MSASFRSAKVLAQEVVEFDYRAECTTEATGGDGVRHGCSSEWSTHTVPSGYVYIENKLEKGTTSNNGSENYCDHEFSDQVEVVPNTGITHNIPEVGNKKLVLGNKILQIENDYISVTSEFSVSNF
jgi:hypothetical protein